MTSLRLSLPFALLAACAPGSPRPVQAPAPAVPAPVAADVAPVVAVPRPSEPVVPPPLALLAGLMPLRSTGVEQFRAAHPTYDGRGVLIGILDSGIDPGVAGLVVTSTGAPKILDLRDFSGEGRVALEAVRPDAGTLVIAGRTLRGAARIGRLAIGATWYAGVFHELPLGPLPAADVNGNGTNTDVFPVVVVRAVDGWVVFFDSNLNGSFEDEQPLHDYRQGRETIALGRQPLTLAANLSGASGIPQLDLYFDTQGHGTHVAGIAAGHGMFNLSGFEGVAPGAQLIGLKIANDARGGISVSGSMQRAMTYAAQFAAQRGLPLVLNMSFGVGNERAGQAVIDSVVDAFLLAHPEVVFTISAGNDGPGLSTVGFPGSADLALSVGALEPGAFLRAPQPGPPSPDRMGWWSSRGGDLAKPDLLAPGQAFSTVPRWNLGDEIKIGTSMAAPHVAGLIARLASAMVQEHRPILAADLTQALRATATPLVGWNVLDQGAGVPRLEAAYRWLVAGHQGSRYEVRSASGMPAAMRRAGFTGPADTIQVFTVSHADGLRAAQFRLTSDVPWLSAPALVTAQPRATTIQIGYRPSLLTVPGVYVGTITARNPTDSSAGSLFSVVNTVVVPYDLSGRALADSGRSIGPGRVQRYFLRVPVAGTSLRLTVSLREADHEAVVQLYDPHGRPASANPDSLVVVGYGKAARVVIEIPAEDVEAGVYELVVFNPGTGRSTAAIGAELAPVTLAVREDGALEVSNPGTTTAALLGRAALVGAERRVTIQGRGAPTESVTVALPPWAARAEVLVEMAQEQWDRFTDFGLTAFDSAGQQVQTTPMNYARGRQTFDVPARLAGHPVVFELLPAFARADAPSPWTARVRVRVFTDSGSIVDSGVRLDIVPGGRAALPVPTSTPLALPDGFAPLVVWRLTPASGTTPDAVGFQPIRQP
jgi:subtilisin family serine protease